MALLKVVPGDVIAIPAKIDEEVGYVLARVIEHVVAVIVEVFGKFHRKFDVTDNYLRSLDYSRESRLFAPVLVSFDFNKHFGKVKWPVLIKVGSAEECKTIYREVEFAEMEYKVSGRFERGGVWHTEPSDARRQLEGFTIWSNTQLIHRINLHLSGRLAQGEVFRPARMAAFIAAEGPDWLLAELEECRILAEEVGTRFREFRKV